MSKYSDFPSQTSLRPKSAIYTLKRDFEHPCYFHTEVPPGNKIRQNKEREYDSCSLILLISLIQSWTITVSPVWNVIRIHHSLNHIIASLLLLHERFQIVLVCFL